MSNTDTDPDPEPVESTDRKDADVLLADPEDYHNAQRLREIHEARRNVHTVLNEIEMYTSSKDHIEQKHRLANAVAAYLAELEPLVHQTDHDLEYEDDTLPWDSALEYASTLGQYNEDGDLEVVGYTRSMHTFQMANQFLAEVKPLITEDDTDEWEV